MADSPGFAALPPRQKVIVVIFLTIAIFVVWELIGLFRGGKDKSSMISPAPSAVAAQAPVPKSALPKSPPPPVQQMSGPAPHGFMSPHLAPQQSHPEVDTTPPASIVLVQQEQVQSKYVTALNELQMLKIQKEIAETSQAIVAAKLATATAEKSISDLVAEAENPVTTNSHTPPPGASSTTIMPPGLPPGVGPDAPGSYSVQSVTMEQDQWHAVVKFKDKLYDVSVGDQLPPDKSLVKAIDQRGVTLDTAGAEQRIPLTVTDNEPTDLNTSTPGGTHSGPIVSPAP